MIDVGFQRPRALFARPLRLLAVIIPQVTLAFLEDTGWYEVNYAMANCTREKLHYGFRQGCRFVEGPCVDMEGIPMKTEPGNHFCAEHANKRQRRCLPSLRGYGYCNANFHEDQPFRGGYEGFTQFDGCPTV